MPPPVVAACLAVLSMELAIGVAANGLIVAMNIDWLKSRSFRPSDILLSSLGLTRLGFQFMLMINYVLQFIFPKFTSQEPVYKPLSVLTTFFSFFSLWNATWLCVFYCVKIANFSHPVFTRLKLGFSKWLPWLLLGSMLVSLGCSLPFIWNMNDIFGKRNSTFSGDHTAPAFMGNISYLYWISLCILGSSPPYFLFFLAAALLIVSLCQNARRMKRNGMGGFRSPSLKAYFGAVKTVTIFFLFYASFVITVYVSVSDYAQSKVWASCICAVVISAYPSLHSVFLIMGNAKLKKVSCRILLCTMGYSREDQQVTSIST